MHACERSNKIVSTVTHHGDAICSQRQHGQETLAVRNASRTDNRDRDFARNTWHKHQTGNIASMGCRLVP
jgi:hypothetical protein